MSQTANTFNDGQAYERTMGRWSQVVATQFLDWLGLGKGLRWLDVGCGNGAFTEMVIGRCAPASVAAIDPSEGQIAYARTRPGATMAEFRVGDAQTLPYDSASFDAAAMALVISFIPDPAKAVRELTRVVRPGGWAGTYMWDFEGNAVPHGPLAAAFDAMGLRENRPVSWQVATQQAMHGLWEGAGMQSVETRAIRIPVSFADFDDFWASNAVPVGPRAHALAKLTPAELDRLRDRLREQLPAGPDGRITYEACANAVKGRIPG